MLGPRTQDYSEEWPRSWSFWSNSCWLRQCRWPVKCAQCIVNVCLCEHSGRTGLLVRAKDELFQPTDQTPKRPSAQDPKLQDMPFDFATSAEARATLPAQSSPVCRFNQAQLMVHRSRVRVGCLPVSHVKNKIENTTKNEANRNQ